MSGLDKLAVKVVQPLMLLLYLGVVLALQLLAWRCCLARAAGPGREPRRSYAKLTALYSAMFGSAPLLISTSQEEPDRLQTAASDRGSLQSHLLAGAVTDLLNARRT